MWKLNLPNFSTQWTRSASTLKRWSPSNHWTPIPRLIQLSCRSTLARLTSWISDNMFTSWTLVQITLNKLTSDWCSNSTNLIIPIAHSTSCTEMNLLISSWLGNRVIIHSRKRDSSKRQIECSSATVSNQVKCSINSRQLCTSTTPTAPNRIHLVHLPTTAWWIQFYIQTIS
jgi:hypothetical protein